MDNPAPGVMIAREDGGRQEVWKFELEPDGTGGGRSRVSMPSGAKAVSVGVQRDRFYLWAVVAPALPTEVRTFYVIGTGHQVPREAHTYLGRITVGAFEFHAFEGFQ
jgi:hypothetical protein